ncbi:MAG: hypothetical protein ABS949_09550 [Solibacillus sp.]
MKKPILIISILFALAAALVFNSKLYYPALPIETVTKKEVLEKVKLGEPITALAIENGKHWYIIQERNQARADALLIDMLRQDGWHFTEKDGSGLFFQCDGKRLIVTTQKWTGDYVLVDVPL